MNRVGRELQRSEETLHRPSSAACSSRSVGGSSRRDSQRSSGLFSIFRWFKREKSDESQEDSPPQIGTLRRADGSLSGSVDTLFSTATARSFAYVSPNHYRPYGAANPPEIRINPGPETSTYRSRIRQRDLLRKTEKNVSLKEKYQLYASETLPRSVDKIHEIRETTVSPSESKNSSIRRRKRRAPPPPNKSDSTSETSLPAALGFEDRENQETGREHRRTLSEPSPTRYAKACHIQGKRKAPQPPSDSKPGERTLSLQRKKRPAPPPPIQRSPSDEITEILQGAANNLTGSDTSLNNLETTSTASTVDISQTEIVSTDTLRLERGYLKPARGETAMEVKYTPTSPVSPRPWYKRNSASRENSFSRSNDKKKEREKRRIEDWMIESGIPRRPNHLPENKFNIFARMDKTEEKRRSQISILTNISELDREAAEIVQKNKEREKAMLANQNSKFYNGGNELITNGYFNQTRDRQLNGAQNLIGLFNSVTHLTNVAVNSAFYLHREDSTQDQGQQAAKETLHRIFVDGEKAPIQDGAISPIITEPQPGPSGVGKIARVTIEELDDFDKERNSRAQAMYEANRLQRHQPPIIPTIKEVSESAAATPASRVANTPSEPTMPALPGALAPAKSLQRVPAIPASVLKPVVHVVWDCPRCTLENPRWRITCEACDMWRPVPCDFKEVTPKHPLPLAVLRIIEPKDQDSVVITDVTESPSSSQSNGLQSNAPARNKNDLRLDLKDIPTKRSSQGLTISDLLFNTQGNIKAKDITKDKDALNGLDLLINIDKDRPGKLQRKQDTVSNKPLNTSKLRNLGESQPTPSASGSSISSLSSTNSDHIAANTLESAPKRDLVEAEAIRKARLAFFDKFGQSSSQSNADSKTVHVDCSPVLSKNSEASEFNTSSQKITSPLVITNNFHQRDNQGITKVAQSSISDSEKLPTASSSRAPDINNHSKDSSYSDRSESQPKPTVTSNFESNIKASPRVKQRHTVQEEGSVKETQTSSVEALDKDDGSKSKFEEDKRKLREMLKEMKHSLPKRSKEKSAEEKNDDSGSYKPKAEHSFLETRAASPKQGAIRKTPVPTPRKTVDNKTLASKENKAEAYLVESTTIIEEIKMKKPTENTSCQTANSVVRQISPQTKPPSGKEVVVPITVEEFTIQDGVLYTSVSKKAKRIGSGTFQLMRPRDFANIKAIKTGKHAGDCADTPMYANLQPSTDEDKKEVEKLSLQLTEPQGLAHFRAGLANSVDVGNVNTIAVNRLLRRLESAIAGGQHELAAALAKELAQLKVNCVVTRQKSDDSPKSEIQLEMYVEDKERHQGPYSLKVGRHATVADLKAKVEREFEIPSGVQRWIIGRVLANDDSRTLESFGVVGCGFPVFLYLVIPDEGEQAGVAECGDPQEEEEGAVGGDPPTLTEEVLAALGQLKTSEQPNEARAVSSILSQQTQPRTETVTSEARVRQSGAATESLESKLSPMETADDSWKCGRCTLVNTNDRLSCAACGSSLDQGLEKTNVPQRPRRKEKPIESGTKSGDTTDSEVNIKKEANDEKTRDYQKLVDLEKSDLIISTEPFECPICISDYPPGEGVVLRECLHVFCRPCLANTVEYSDEAEVKCPFRDNNYTCDSTLLEREIKSLVTPHVYEQHLAKSIALAETKIGNAFHCKTPDCKGWCIFEDNVNNFKCPVCSRSNCLTCQAIHEDLDCKQFQERLNNDSEVNAESKRTKEMLQEMVDRGEALNCPTCQVVLMKKWGCDWLRCSMCKTEICWITRGPRWGPNGKGDTSGGCQCGVNGVKCHPKCTYCH